MNKAIWTLATLATVVVPAALEAQVNARSVVVVRTLRRSDRIIADTMGSPFDVPGSPARTLNALKEVYAELKIETPLLDSVELEIGNEKFFKRGSLAGRRLSGFVDCGSGLTGEYADNHRVDFSLVTFVRPNAEDRSTIRTVLLGAAINVTEGAKPTQYCNSNGELERLIHQRVTQKLRM
jgi:hypothetical protein